MLKAGIVGFGGMGRVHAAQYPKVRDAELVAIADERPEQLEARALEEILGASGADGHCGVRTYRSGEQMLARERLDVVDICLPTHLHAECAITAMRAGCHVLCEKPMARTLEEADDMLRTASETGRALMIAQCLRFWPAYVRVREAHLRSEFGRLLMLSMRRFGPMPDRDGTHAWFYRPRGPDPLRTLFRRRFPDFQAAYEQHYAATYGRFRLPLITRAASAFRVCGDWSQGIARIRCPSCDFDRFRPFSCKSYLLCPSCAQKRTLLVGEYLSEDLLLTLPHRQFVWTIPKILRVFLRHDRELFADLSRLLFDILRRFFCQAAGRSLRCAMVSSHQTFGEFGVWHPHWHTIVLEGGFDHHNTFFFIPLGATAALIEIWRRRVVALFLEKGLLNPDFARKILGWQHSGFSIESGTRILDQPTREALCQYLVRAPLSLRRIRWDEQQDTVT